MFIITIKSTYKENFAYSHNTNTDVCKKTNMISIITTFTGINNLPDVYILSELVNILLFTKTNPIASNTYHIIIRAICICSSETYDYCSSFTVIERVFYVDIFQSIPGVILMLYHGP